MGWRCRVLQMRVAADIDCRCRRTGFFWNSRPVNGMEKRNLQTLYGFLADDDEREEAADDVILDFDFEKSTSAEALQL